MRRRVGVRGIAHYNKHLLTRAEQTKECSHSRKLLRCYSNFSSIRQHAAEVTKCMRQALFRSVSDKVGKSSQLELAVRVPAGWPVMDWCCSALGTFRGAQRIHTGEQRVHLVFESFVFRQKRLARLAVAPRRWRACAGTAAHSDDRCIFVLLDVQDQSAPGSLCRCIMATVEIHPDRLIIINARSLS